MEAHSVAGKGFSEALRAHSSVNLSVSVSLSTLMSVEALLQPGPSPRTFPSLPQGLRVRGTDCGPAPRVPGPEGSYENAQHQRAGDADSRGQGVTLVLGFRYSGGR